MGRREVVRVVHRKPAPHRKDDVQVVRHRDAHVEALVHDLILLGEAEDLTVRIAQRDLDHMREVRYVWNVSRHMEPEKPAHHDRCLDFAPVGFRRNPQQIEVRLIRVPD